MPYFVKLRKRILQQLGCSWLAGATLVWLPNTESDLAGYKVHAGERSRQYTTVIDVGKRTDYSLDGFSRRQALYLAVTAYDSSGNESAYSQEVILPAEGGEENKPGSEGTLERVYNFPNPFKAGREATTLRYFLAAPAAVTARVFDVKGELIRLLIDHQPRPAGENLADVWDGTDTQGSRVSPGLYYIEIETEGKKSVARVAILP